MFNYSHSMQFRNTKLMLGALLSLILALSVSGALASSARAVEPIEGTWIFQGGEVFIEPTGTNTFKGTVVKVTQFASCPHPVGQVMWEMTGSGNSYSGTHSWYHNGDCTDNPGGASTWTITSTDPNNFQLNFCSQAPGEGPVTPSSSCTILTRAKPPVPDAKEVFKLPSSKGCISKRKFRIKIKRPDGFTLVSGKVFVNNKSVKVLKKKILGQKRLTATVNFKGLPKGTFKVKIQVVTSTGDTIKATRTYKTCSKKNKQQNKTRL